MSMTFCQPKEVIASKNRQRAIAFSGGVSCDRGLLKGERVEEAIASATSD
jgi:hypothetical protein